MITQASKSYEQIINNALGLLVVLCEKEDPSFLEACSSHRLAIDGILRHIINIAMRMLTPPPKAIGSN